MALTGAEHPSSPPGPTAARLLLVPLLMVLVAVGSAMAESRPLPSMPDIERFGLDGFRLLLQQQGAIARQKSFVPALRSPKTTVLVLFGDTRPALSMWASIQRFVDRGGAVLVATDRGNAQLAGLRFKSFRQAAMPFPPAAAYQQHRDCPRVTDLDQSHPLLEGVDELISNRPGYLVRIQDTTTRPIAWLPHRGRQRVPLIAVGTEGQKLILVADHSLFINEMLLHGANARFASNVAKWLCDDGGRTDLVFIDSGLVLPAWQATQGSAPVPLRDLLSAAQQVQRNVGPLPKETLVAFLNRFLTTLEDKNGFNTTLLSIPVPSLTSVRRSLALTALAVIAAVFLHWLLRTNWRLDGWASTRRMVLVDPGQLGGSPHDYGTSLRLLAREFFSQTNGPSALHWCPAAPGPEVVDAADRSVRGATREVRYFWKLANASDAPELRSREFEKLVKRLRRLRQFQNAGILQLKWP